ncbi:MAG: hypothetical protein J7496_14985 [Novosphingobium sp.]|nr:hypothetical protein [Novosphingobium sp.]MBO9603805.1 hypothetical protein [Novosphingobium sp.]
MRLRLLLAAATVLLASGASAEAANASRFEALAQAVAQHDVEAAKALFPDEHKVISWFNGKYYLDSFEVLMENFKDSERLANVGDNNAAFSICGGKATYILQYRESAEKGVEIFYGTAETPPPPVPYSMRAAKSHCDGVVRYVGGL